MILLKSKIKPGDGVTAPLRVVFSKQQGGKLPYVTHLENMQVGGRFAGHYFDDRNKAIEDFMTRCKKENVEEAL